MQFDVINARYCFKNCLKDISIKEGEYQVSHAAEALFASFPLEECVQLITKELILVCKNGKLACTLM